MSSGKTAVSIRIIAFLPVVRLRRRSHIFLGNKHTLPAYIFGVRTYTFTGKYFWCTYQYTRTWYTGIYRVCREESGQSGAGRSGAAGSQIEEISIVYPLLSLVSRSVGAPHMMVVRALPPPKSTGGEK